MLPTGWRTITCMQSPEENDKYNDNCQPLLVQYKQQANPLVLMRNYTPVVIIGEWQK